MLTPIRHLVIWNGNIRRKRNKTIGNSTTPVIEVKVPSETRSYSFGGITGKTNTQIIGVVGINGRGNVGNITGVSTTPELKYITGANFNMVYLRDTEKEHLSTPNDSTVHVPVVRTSRNGKVIPNPELKMWTIKSHLEHHGVVTIISENNDVYRINAVDFMNAISCSQLRSTSLP